MNSKNFSLNLSKIGQIAIGVSDIDRATEFYPRHAGDALPVQRPAGYVVLRLRRRPPHADPSGAGPR